MSDDVDMNEQQTPAQRGFNGALGMRARGVIAAGWALDRAEEVAASVAALTERVDASEAYMRSHAAMHMRQNQSPVPPPPGADEPARLPQTGGDAFLDALCQEYARRGFTGSFEDCGVQFRMMFSLVTASTGSVEQLHTAMLERAAALPERSAPAPVTIPQAQFNWAAHVYEIATNERCNYRGLRAAVESLGIEIRPIEVTP